MCIVCDQNAEIARKQQEIQQRAHAINHRQSISATVIQIPSTLGINQQLAVAAYQQRVQQELQRKSGIRQPQKHYR